MKEKHRKQYKSNNLPKFNRTGSWFHNIPFNLSPHPESVSPARRGPWRTFAKWPRCPQVRIQFPGPGVT